MIKKKKKIINKVMIKNWKQKLLIYLKPIQIIRRVLMVVLLRNQLILKIFLKNYKIIKINNFFKIIFIMNQDLAG